MPERAFRDAPAVLDAQVHDTGTGMDCAQKNQNDAAFARSYHHHPDSFVTITAPPPLASSSTT